MSDSYEVGYGKPPKHSRFKPGQSGNPKGRPKSRKNMRTIVNDVMERPVLINENGRPRRVKFLEAFVHQMAAKALSGSTRDQLAMFKTIHDYAPELLNEPIRKVTVEYVLPDGKTMESYHNPAVDENNERSNSKLNQASAASPNDDADSWLK